MKNLKLFLILLTSAIFSLSSCKNNDDDKPIKSKEEILTSNKWKVTGATGVTTHSLFGEVKIDLYNNKVFAQGMEVPASQFSVPSYPDCAKDNLMILATDRRYSVEEGSSVCSGASEYTFTKGTWNLNSDASVLTLKEDAGREWKFEISTLTEEKIEGKTQSNITFGGADYQYVLTTTFTAP